MNVRKWHWARGEQAEALALVFLLARTGNTDVAKPMTSNGPADIVWRTQDKDGAWGGWQSAQVKRVYMKDGHPTVNMSKRTGKRYAESDADWVMAVDVDALELWLIPMHEASKKTRIRLTSKYDYCRWPIVK
jgi:hypothetical protein